MPIIHFKSVSKNFTEDSYAVKDVSFSVEPGEIIFITGPSGSGKTTLMRLLTREYTPTDGEVFFKDQPLSELSAGNIHAHRRRIGVVFQDYQLVPEMNVWENIALPLYVSGKNQEEIEQRVTDLLNLIKLPDKADQFPSQLSGGEAQRVSIARALAVGPELIFADEPTGNLDVETSKAIGRLLKKINELGTTILIATHDLEIMHEHDDLRHIMLENGKLMSDTTPKSKKSASTVKKEVSKTETESKSSASTKKDADIKKSDQKQQDQTQTVGENVTENSKIETKKPSFWSSFFKKKAPKPSLTLDEKSTDTASEKTELDDIQKLTDAKSDKKQDTEAKANNKSVDKLKTKNK